jgi:Asp-tRNA(Asn)/Glu-tRNA(Gln) amidotransferase A subunit family amidase
MTVARCLSATETAIAVGNGTLTAETAIGICLDRIDARDSAVQGWAFLDAAGARVAARASDAAAYKRPLEGVAIGIKDVIDVAGLPTAHGSPIYTANIAAADAECVRRLRAAGAIILGKTITAEFATYSPGPTINPHRPGHTPGGSSSGSAATVADGQVPIALGTQTAGSMIRPASYCGVFGFKPSFGRYPLGGVLETAPHLDTLGVFARSLADVRRVDAVLAADDSDPPVIAEPVIGLCRSPAWDQADAAMQQAFIDFAETLRKVGLTVVERALPDAFAGLTAAQVLLHRHEAFHALGHIRRDHPGAVSAVFRDFIDVGAADTPAAYADALALQAQCKALLVEVFDGVDMLLVPGATGAAPHGLDATGNPAFQRIWTALGVPCLGFPVRWTDAGLPLGLQLVGPPQQDRAFLASAAAVVEHAAQAANTSAASVKD